MMASPGGRPPVPRDYAGEGTPRAQGGAVAEATVLSRRHPLSEVSAAQDALVALAAREADVIEVLEQRDAVLAARADQSLQIRG